MKLTTHDGLLLATAAAALFAAGCATDGGSDKEGTELAVVKCQGVNACKGNTQCATASNACKGQNSCKGQGWIALSKKECKAKGGEVM